MTALLTFLKSRLGGWVVGGLATALMFFLWQLSAAKVEALKEREKVHIANAIVLKGAIETQQQAIELTGKLSEATLGQLTDLQADLKNSREETSLIEREINDLRATEEANALKEPYERGLAAHTRLDRIMQRLTGNRSDKDGIDTNTEQTDDSQGAIPRDAGDANTPSDDS